MSSAEAQTFGALLRASRERSGKSLRQLAAHLDLSSAHLSFVGRGQNRPLKEADIKRAAAFLGADERALLAAAIETRGVAKLAAVGVSDRHLVVGAALARAWRELTQEQLEAIAAVIEGAEVSR